ncbi:hypothetical protein G7074_00365 [Pedobacter sp. HDW13]|uniref:hypothetical protein n=1 Tax=Pedobacter sp. HDW13 TaxID=2714940 RepID=UPI00140CFE87|nr:hypothetical protein [Pedobacter sp. HDW13]QIL37874.1 hypothetical protein G7074_00365 [Pedobacter sp. HDW13]
MPAIIKTDDYLHNEEIQIDSFLDNELLIQEFNLRLNNIDLSTKAESIKKGIKQKIVFLCYNLYIDGTFQVHGADLLIFCRNIYANNNAIIDTSGNDALEKALQKGSRKDKNGDNPDGDDADNKRPDGILYDINGQNGGNVEIYSENISGQLKIITNGGNGNDGQNGDFGLDGRNALSFPTYKKLEQQSILYSGQYIEGEFGGAYVKDYIRFSIFKGEDGTRPGNGGKGADGGNGGNGGRIDVYNHSSSDIVIESKPGKGGTGGKGGKYLDDKTNNFRRTHGGIGGVSKYFMFVAAEMTLTNFERIVKSKFEYKNPWGGGYSFDEGNYNICRNSEEIKNYITDNFDQEGKCRILQGLIGHRNMVNMGVMEIPAAKEFREFLF